MKKSAFTIIVSASLIAVAGITFLFLRPQPVDVVTPDRRFLNITESEVGDYIHKAEAGDGRAALLLYRYYLSMEINPGKSDHYLKLSASLGNHEAKAILGTNVSPPPETPPPRQ
jgi:hypothetical protein